jgi:hypothetical protein
MKLWHEPSPDEYNEAFAEIEELIPYLMATTWENEDARKALLVVAEGVEIMIAMLMSRTTGEKLGINLSDVEEWLAKYKDLYMSESKLGELKEFVLVFYALAQKYLK